MLRRVGPQHSLRRYNDWLVHSHVPGTWKTRTGSNAGQRVGIATAQHRRTSLMQQPYPDAIVRFLSEYHSGGVTESDCRACSSPCCSLGGFAVLENVVQIYELYQHGGLRRADYEYEPGLSF